MAENNLDDLFTKVKTVTKKAADATAKQAKLARLRINLMTLHSERSRYLQNIGGQIFSFYKQGKKFDELVLFADLKADITAIENIDQQIEAIEIQIQAYQQDNVEVKDVTPQ